MEFYILINNVELVKTVGESTAQGAKTGTEEVNTWLKASGKALMIQAVSSKKRPRNNSSSFEEQKMQARSHASTPSGKRLVAMLKLVYHF
jgi:hypothetical protein